MDRDMDQYQQHMMIVNVEVNSSICTCVAPFQHHRSWRSQNLTHTLRGCHRSHRQRARR